MIYSSDAVNSTSDNNPAPVVGGQRRKTRFAVSENLEEVFLAAGRELRNGQSSKALRLLEDSIANRSHSPNDLANLKRLMAFTLETLGRYKESLDSLRPYEEEVFLKSLEPETRIRISTQLAICWNNVNDHPKAVTLLKDNLEKARSAGLHHLLGSINTALARVYRKLNECAICRDYAEKALSDFRATGDWLGMAEAYREIAISFHQEGRSERSIEYFQLGIEIIGDRSAPFMLGKIYTDLSGAYWFLRQPKKGIECLERSVEFFEKTEHVLNSVIAYNNLGINLMLIGEWQRAERMIRRSLELALPTKHAHIAGILDSLGELNILRGEYEAAERNLSEAVSIARRQGRLWYEVQALRNLARLFLAKGEPGRAEEIARETIEKCREIGDKHYANMSGLVLAESLLGQERRAECENYLEIVEESNPVSDYFVLGNIQRIRGLAAAAAGNGELSIHHLRRALTHFEAAGDVYYTALANYLLGKHLPADQFETAAAHLTQAIAGFRSLNVTTLHEAAESELRRVETTVSKKKHTGNKQNPLTTQLLTVRVAEATASRELLFRELIAILRQETNAGRAMIADAGENRRLKPFITHGFSVSESIELLGKYEVARDSGNEKIFQRRQNLAVFQLKPSNGPSAVLFIYPVDVARLSDGSPLDALLRVVELGMEVIALRERDFASPAGAEIGSYVPSSLMPGFIHSSPAMSALVEEVYKIRSSDVTVLVTGESGTGKELVSRAIHTVSNRKDRVFVPFNCNALPRELAEGQLFGYKKGAFTGAYTDSVGIIRTADGGTLFLDEIGDLPLEVQPKLLRFLQEGEVQPIGEKRPVKVDVRVIAATNMPLEEKVAAGTFREDLFYRLNVIRLHVPPLRERRSEIPPMVNYYVNHYSARFNKRDITFLPQTIDLLMVCDWEGNVRQLCNEIQRIVARAEDGEVITPEHLSPEVRRTARRLVGVPEASHVVPITTDDGQFRPFAEITPGRTLEEAVAEMEMKMIRESLRRHNWNISRVAAELGITRRGLYMKIARYGIEKAA
ncbi:MAG: hypothetical protein C4324_08145 [Blastocatellia bacterium]